MTEGEIGVESYFSLGTLPPSFASQNPPPSTEGGESFTQFKQFDKSKFEAYAMLKNRKIFR